MVPHFYPRSPCGERHCQTVGAIIARRHFYPRSPCGERQLHRHCHVAGRRFLSTLSLRRATACWYIKEMTANISIHALLAESDQTKRLKKPKRLNFYPRSPCGERQLRVVRGDNTKCISIHALLAESDKRETREPIGTLHFYPRSPCGERHITQRSASSFPSFLSTLSLRRATAKVHKTVGHFCAYETNFMGIASSC